MTHRMIDLETWPRRELFALFREMDHPYFGVTAEVDVTAWLPAVRAAGMSVYQAMVHRVTSAANAVEAFRIRIRGEGAVVHDRIHVSFTVLWREELFNFCNVEFEEDAEAFLARARVRSEIVSAAPTLVLDEAWRDDVIYASCAPWYTFTALSQVGDARSLDSIPRIAWGKIVERDGRQLLSMNVQLHHAVADGRHIGQFFEQLEAGLAAQALSLT